MARIIVVADSHDDPRGMPLYQERAMSCLLEDPFASGQLVERLAWAVADAEKAERALKLGTDSSAAPGGDDGVAAAHRAVIGAR